MINCIDLFVGCGGLTEGFEKAGGFNSLALVDWEKMPCKTLEKRLESKWGYPNASEIVLEFDIQRTNELLQGWKNENNHKHNGLFDLVGGESVNIIIGGPPCQAYSIAGRVRDKNGMRYDYRNYLFESYIEIVKRFQPEIFVFENVEGILSAKPGGKPIVNRIFDSFGEIGYSTIGNLRKHALLNSADYGVPQVRKRVIVIGVNEKKIKGSSELALLDFYERILPTYKVQKFNTVGSAILDLPALMPLPQETKINGRKVSHNYNGHSVVNHIPRFHSKRDQEIFIELAKDKMNGGNRYPDSKSLIQLYFEKTGKKSNFHKYHVLDRNKPSNTIPAHLYKDGLRHIHPDPGQARSITPREAARLQGFDDDFEFLGSMGDQYKMIGNAVPPILAERVAKAVKLFYGKYF